MMYRDWITAFDALYSVFNEGAYSNAALNEALNKRSEVNHAFVRNFVKGTISRTITIDMIIDELSLKGIRAVKKRPLTVIRMGIFAIRYLDSVPDHAACNHAVDIAKSVCRGETGFVNAILRSYIRERSRFADASFISDPSDIIRMSYRYSYSPSQVEIFVKQYGSCEAERIMDALNTAPLLSLRTNGIKIGRAELLEMLTDRDFDVYADPDSDMGIFARGAGYLNDGLYRDGYYSIQTASSIECIEAMEIKAGAMILDMCAAPGGKSAYMAELMKNSGHIIAEDIYEHRLELIEKNARRLGIEIIETRLADGTLLQDEFLDRFDYVLCDVPCSGTGVIGSKPEIKFRAAKDLHDLTDTQLKLLSNAYKYAKPDGRIMYSTCSLNKEENERVIERFLTLCPNARVVEMKTILPYNNKVGFFHCLIERK